MKLQVTQRSIERKKESKRVRRDGKIPAVIYNRGKDADAVSVDASEFAALLRQVPKGRLPTTVIKLSSEGSKEQKAIVKEIQYHPITYDVQHLDFEALSDKVPVTLKVPVECVGVIDCVGVKQGGVLRTVMRHVKVKCLPKDIPESFLVDVTDLELLSSKRLKHLEIPQTVRLMANENNVAVTVAKR